MVMEIYKKKIRLPRNRFVVVVVVFASTGLKLLEFYDRIGVATLCCNNTKHFYLSLQSSISHRHARQTHNNFV